MRIFTTFLGILCCCSMMLSAQEGVDFREFTLEEALNCAKMENKWLFIDCYTSWCGPCKAMAKEVFSLKKVGDFMNQQFVSIKVDMEKGEGPSIRQRFGVQSFPTFLILKSDGTLWHRLVGRETPEQFLAKLNETLESSNTLGSMDMRYVSGERGQKFLTDYLQLLMAGKDKRAEKIADELFAILDDTDRQSMRYRFLYENKQFSTYGSAIFRYWFEHRKFFATCVGEKTVENLITDRLKNRIDNILAMTDTLTTMTDAAQMVTDANETVLKNDSSFLIKLEIVKAVASGDQELILTTCEKWEPAIDFQYFPFSLAFVSRDKLSAKQLERWISLCKKVIDRRQDKALGFKPFLELMDECYRKASQTKESLD